MNTQHDHHGSGFFNGFLLGAVIGAAVVFFLFTDKGKKLLKTITEEGMEGFSDLKDLVESEMEDDEAIYEDEDERYEEAHPMPHVVHHADHSHVEPIQGYSEPHKVSKVKRFFRGAKR